MAATLSKRELTDAFLKDGAIALFHGNEGALDLAAATHSVALDLSLIHI